MPDYYIGQIVMAGFGFAPTNYATCDGQVLRISQNSALYSLIGVTYGGDGRNTYQLPDLRGRTPVGGYESQNPDTQAQGYVPYNRVLGQVGGTETVVLNATQNPAHTHTLVATATTGVNQYLDGAALLAPVSDPARLYSPATALVPLSGGRSTVIGGTSHENMQPFEAINFVICLQGIFPSRN